MGSDKLRKVRDLKAIKGIPYPADVSFRSLIVTGPPGTGKSSRIAELGGWPGELFLDLTRKHWWRDRTLAVRPREVHLGLPFAGHREGLALFEEIRQEPSELVFEPDRLRLPPERRGWNPVDWRRRFVFEFLLPPAEEVLAVRQERAAAQTHPVDRTLYLVQIQHQLELYLAVAGLLHHAGLRVFVRTDFEAEPRRFEPAAESGMPAPALPRRRSGSRGRRAFERVIGRLLGIQRKKAKTELEQLQLAGEQVLLSRDLLPVELSQSGVRLHLYRDQLVLPSEQSLDALILRRADARSDRIQGFARFGRHERVRMTHGTQGLDTSLSMPSGSELRLEIANTDAGVAITDLHSERGTELRALPPRVEDSLVEVHRLNVERLHRLLGRPVAACPTELAHRTLRRVLDNLAAGSWRPADAGGAPGGLVELPGELCPVIVGDLHANVDNLLKILSVNGFLAEIEAGTAVLIFLGDAVHCEEDGDLEEMDSSLLMMDIILRLMAAYPEHVVYLRGNHDSFSSRLRKEGVPQGSLWRRRMEAVHGIEFRRDFERFYALCPLVATSSDFVACHAGPPQSKVSRKKLINVKQHERLAHQLMWNRLKRPGHPAGYGKHDVKALKVALDLPKKAALVVSHNPLRDGRAVWLNAGGIKRHHVVYSAGSEELAVFTRLDGRLRPLVYRAELMLSALGAGGDQEPG